MEWTRWVRREARKLRTVESLEIVRKTYFLGGKHNFDDFMIAMEWNREPKARFWLPRRGLPYPESRVHEWMRYRAYSCQYISDHR